ncbi:uncharacterized protein LOC120257299 [Dioscorea cayenensis subsp. rotundata]|uniref:Uncharacterized protein LOC120257299 n=1 Tax=Dioscorea cayennensis subsp. rotundata TaxID=55577 RepID=A0AB40B0C5_DIOCR|nr:uncharacterized protein LOC120257299 [Dioscorea cayenensis subsp. rotundata]
MENLMSHISIDAHGNQDVTTKLVTSVGPLSYNTYEQMVIDAGGLDFSPTYMEEPPNAVAQKFFDMLRAANQEAWPGCKNHSQLSVVARMLNMKAEHHLSEKCFNDFCQFLKEMLPADNAIPSNFYITKKLVQGLGLPVEKIHCCLNGCMIYWGVDSEQMSCKICEHPRYKRQQGSSYIKKNNIPYKKMYYFPLTSRLQRLYASNATAKEMRWHAEHEAEEGVMRHCSDSLAWKHFSNTHPSFAAESWNVRLGLCTDGFQPFGQSGQQFSSWPVIVTPYNLPPSMCMKEEYMFLTVIVLGPRNPKDMLDVYLQPLIAELRQLWEIGAETYDASRKNNFQMRAALMWTISDFPAFSMLSEWSTAGRKACPYCKEDSDAFTLTRGGKQSWFDNHRNFLPPNHPFRKNKTDFRKNRMVTKMAPTIQTRDEIFKEIQDLKLKRVMDTGAYETNSRIAKTTGWRKCSIFWDLPYWRTNLICHNLDVMHIEKNVFENIFNTVMNVEGKTKDNAKSREDLKEFCYRPELERNDATGKYPKACYTLDKQSKIVLCEWLRNLRFPDGYASNMSRCIDMRKLKLFGMKSHDCHVFMKRLLPIAFKELLPLGVCRALTELSNFFKELTSTTIREEDMLRLNEEIPLILCKLERIFPQSFFDSMEHLPVHLAYEAWIAGPIQYRWMYPFER